MKKRILIALGVLVLAAGIGAGGWYYYTHHAGSAGGSDIVYVTKIDREFQADTYFPNLDQMEDWKMTEEGEEQTCFDLEFAFTKYERC